MCGVERYHIVAIDGGGSGCRVAIARGDGVVLARASGGPANVATNAEQAIANMMGAIRAAASQASLEDDRLRKVVAHAGLAGVMKDDDASGVAERLPFDCCTVTDDRETTVWGALGPNDGAVIAVGTGSFVGVRRNEAVRYFGGWGFQIGDQASGAWLGRTLLERTLLSKDGLEQESDLTKAIMTRFGDLAADIVAYARQLDPRDFAALAPLVVDAAKSGDVTGLALMRLGASYLNAALKTAGISSDEVVCLTGGLGPHYSEYLDAEYRDRSRPPEGSALEGAIQLARKKLEDMEATA